MAFNVINNVAIRGISACVPKRIEENLGLDVFRPGEAERVIAQTGIARKHVVEPGTEMAELAEKAFDKLMQELQWENETLDLLIIVSSSGDYPIPSTANVLHGRLNLPESCFVFDVHQGCTGWLAGIHIAGSLLSAGHMKRAMMICGDLNTILNSPKDKECRPLFGDSCTATALEFDENAPQIEFENGSRGADFEAIMTPEGGYHHPLDEHSLEYKEFGENMLRRGIDCRMDGMGVFGFALSVAPKSFNALCEHFNIDKEQMDYYLFHQANQYMNEKIRKKLKLDAEKVPYSLQDFGNNAGSSIPITIVTQCRSDYANKKLNSIACAFGVGLAWSSMHFVTDHIACPELILY